MPRTAQSIEENKAQRESAPKVQASSEKTQIVQRRGKPRNPNSLANLVPWKPGQTGNPGGRPKHDVGADIARAILENNREAAYKALGQALMKGNAYVFKELCDRAYGKTQNKVEVTGPEGGAIETNVKVEFINGSNG